MSFSALYILPAVALLILIHGKTLSYGPLARHRTRRHKRSTHARVVLMRSLVVMLILATAITKAWPLTSFPALLQGIILTILLMLPVFLYLLMIRPGSGAKNSSKSKRRKSQNTFARNKAALVTGKQHQSTPDNLRPSSAQPANTPLAAAQMAAQPSNPRAPERSLDQSENNGYTSNNNATARSTSPPQSPAPERAPASESAAQPTPAPVAAAAVEEINKQAATATVSKTRKIRVDTNTESIANSTQSQPKLSAAQIAAQAESRVKQAAYKANAFASATKRNSTQDYNDSAATQRDTTTPPPIKTSTTDVAANSRNTHASTTATNRPDKPTVEQAQETESALDQTLSIDEQMSNLDELVDFHDIGNEFDYANASEAEISDTANSSNSLEKAIAVARDAITNEPGILKDANHENLPAKSRVELSEMIVRLRSDKMKLQKLVIAQKSVIDAEKQAHARTRVVVKDAISVMRHARHGQRIAEKIARRERTERQRIEKEYTKVKRALNNALSTRKPDAIGNGNVKEREKI